VHAHAFSCTGRILSDHNDDSVDGSVVTALTAHDSDFFNKLMQAMPWLLWCGRNRIIAGSVRQLPIPNILFHAYKVWQ
jgi:hypothetical protein